MKVLVTAASRHGATTEVAATIGAALQAAGLEVYVLHPAEVSGLDGYDAAVIGSAVYLGRWIGPVRDLVGREERALSRIPVWLFSSGPVGDPPKPDVECADATRLAALIGAREHRVFAGDVDRSRLGLGERVIMAVVRAPEGDYRQWPEIEGWANDIAGSLAGAPAAV